MLKLSLKIPVKKCSFAHKKIHHECTPDMTTTYIPFPLLAIFYTYMQFPLSATLSQPDSDTQVHIHLTIPIQHN